VTYWELSHFSYRKVCCEVVDTDFTVNESAWQVNLLACDIPEALLGQGYHHFILLHE
jgi:hypothetical protein